MQTKLKRQDLIYPDLGYVIVGCVYEVWNELGPGHSELTYQKATSIMFKVKGLKFKEQLPSPVFFKERLVNKRFLDFLVEEKIIVELKKDQRFAIGHIKQVHDYLIRSGLRLGILINFDKDGVRTKRILNSIL
jgi:GxxExxY protein